MPVSAIAVTPSGNSTTSLRQKLFNLFVSPSDVVDEVITSPPNFANWRIPTLFVCLATVISLQTGNFLTQPSVTIHILAETRRLLPAHAHALAGVWPILSALLVCVAIFVGTCWSGFVLWLIGRIFLKVSFPYIKALEIVGLTGIISVLGTITTILLIAASGDPSARPALSLLAAKLDHTQPFYQILETLNIFHLWSASVLAIGLSRLCNVTFKEAGFWVFGYWMVLRIVIIVLQ
jgi:hypothetical protein